MAGPWGRLASWEISSDGTDILAAAAAAPSDVTAVPRLGVFLFVRGDCGQYHGQTLLERPERRRTLLMGTGRIARMAPPARCTRYRGTGRIGAIISFCAGCANL
jgi:hypothetical protein